MKKKILALLTASVMVLGVAACSSSTEETTTEGETTEETTDAGTGSEPVRK